MREVSIFIYFFTAGYIQVCKRDPSTLDSCILKSIEALKPQIISGIPELDVPAIDPFLIPEVNFYVLAFFN